MTYNEDAELVQELADDIEVDRGGRRVTVQLIDSTFHNGDPVTAEDVQFTFEHLSENPGSFPQGCNPPYESIDIVDDKTVEFNLERPFLSLVSREWPRWGIFHKESWVESGAREDPSGFEVEPVIRSGP
jgi:peptide/nickel transport system substrate-binding protein